MPKERPPILSVLLDNERKAKFQAIAQAEERSMGWVIKDMIDRVIAADSIHIYGDSPQPPAAGAIADKVQVEHVSMDDVFTAIDEAIAPIQLDLAELLGQVDDLRVSIEGKSQASRQGASEASKTVEKSTSYESKPAPTATSPDAETMKMIRRFEANPTLRAAATEAIAQGGSGAEISQRLLEAGHSNSKGTAHDPSVITRMRKAVAYLNSANTGEQTNE
jgi:hypothetical protein